MLFSKVQPCFEGAVPAFEGKLRKSNSNAMRGLRLVPFFIDFIDGKVRGYLPFHTKFWPKFC